MSSLILVTVSVVTLEDCMNSLKIVKGGEVGEETGEIGERD